MRRTACLWIGCLVTFVLAPVLAFAAGPKPATVHIAIVTFFSGSGAVVSGPNVDSAKIAAEAINHAGGIAGVPISLEFVDESGGPTKQVAEFRSLAGHVAAVIGYASSADCLAVAPLAKELHVLTLFSGCDGEETYEGQTNPYVFHTIPPDATNGLAMALYVAKMHPNVKTIAGINPDYAYGRDTWKYFTLAMKRLVPDIKLGTALFPALFSGQYTSELARLQGKRPDLVVSSNWGGDAVALIQQALAQGSFGTSLFALTAGTEGGLEALHAVPMGVVFGADYGYLMHPGRIADPKIAAFIRTYRAKTHEYPVSPYPFTMQQSIDALVAEYDAAIKKNGGVWPSATEVASSLVGVHVASVLGAFTIRSDHIATIAESDGITVHSTAYPFAVFDKIITFPASLILPPVGESATAFIGGLTPAYLAKVPAPREYGAH